jgi:acetolactate synthase-1/2/3 large subunit
MPRTQRVVDHIVEHLARIEIDYIFGVDGANIEDLYDAAHFRSDITAVLAKHEFSAATMADGYSRSSAGLGVVAATAGGGALNLIPGLGESLASRVPVLALVGQPATTMDGRGSFQDTSGRNGSLNAEALFSAVSVFCRRVLTPADIVSALPDAIAAARTGGPAVLLLPKDIQQSKVGVNGYDVTGMLLTRRGRSSVIHIRSCALCAGRTDPSRSSPASRWLAMTPGPNSRSCGPCCARRWHVCPTPKM